MQLSDPRANNYLQSLLKVAALFKDNVEAIILFGSHARNEATRISDVDVLIVVKNIEKRKLNHFIANLRFLEFKYDYIKKPQNVLEFLIIYVNIATGMFKSWFVCSKEDLVNLKFSRITNTNFILGKFFAPYKIILYNIQKDGIVVWGNKDILQFIPKIRSISQQWIKSFLLNEIISISSLLISPYTKLSINYTLESIKWSLFNANVKLNDKEILNSSLEEFIKLYLYAKKNGKYSKRLIIYAPYIVLKVHSLAIKNKID